MLKNYRLFCVAFATLALSACGGGNPSGPSDPYGPVLDPLPTTITVSSTEGDVVPGARVVLPDGRTVVSDGVGVVNLGTPLPARGTVFRIEKDPVNQVGGFLGSRIVRFGVDDEPAGSGRYPIQPLRDQFTAEFVAQTNYMNGIGVLSLPLMKAPGPLVFRNRDSDPRIDLALFEQGYRDWLAAGCDTLNGSPAIIDVLIDPARLPPGFGAMTTNLGTAPGVYCDMIFYDEYLARDVQTIKHEIGWAFRFTSGKGGIGITAGWSILGHTRSSFAPDITEFDKMNCVYRAHRKEGNRWVDDATQVR